MITLDVRSNLKGIIRQLNSFERQFVPIATAKALTFTAETVRDAQQWKMHRVFQNPVRWTINSLYIKPATTRDLMSGVFFKDWSAKGVPAGRYLYWQINGGVRQQKSHERRLGSLFPGQLYWMPGSGAVLDSNGNVSGGQFRRLLSQLKSPDWGFAEATNSRRSKKSRKGAAFFKHPSKPIVMLRTGKTVRPFLVATRAPVYRPRFPFYEFGIAVARAKFPIHFEKQLEREIRKAFAQTPIAA